MEKVKMTSGLQRWFCCLLFFAVSIDGPSVCFANCSHHEITLNCIDGMKRKTLPVKNVNGAYILTQEMFKDANTIYVIQENYTLGENIVVPNNCILEFDGGMIDGNHIITGKNTSIKAPIIKIFDENIELDGTWTINEVYPEWFGAKGDGITDDAKPLQTAMDFGSKCKAKTCLTNSYSISSSLIIGQNDICIESVRSEYKSTIIKHFNGDAFVNGTGVFRQIFFKGITIDGNNTKGNLCNFSYNTSEAIRIGSLYIEYCSFKNIKGSALKIDNIYNGRIIQSFFENCENGIKTVSNVNCFNVVGCSFYNTETGVSFSENSYANCLLNCTFQANKTAIDLNSSFGSKIDNCYFEGNGDDGVAVVKGGYVTGASVTNCIFTTGNGKPRLLFSISNGNNFDIRNNYISSGFTDVVLTGKIENSYIQSDILKKSDIPSSYKGVLETMSYHQPSWISGSKPGQRLLYTYYSDGTTPMGDLVWDGTRWAKTGQMISYDVSYWGDTDSRPEKSKIYPGFMYFDTSMDYPKPIWHIGNDNWIEADGAKAGVKRAGTYAEKPKASSIYVGFRYFCTDRKTNEGKTNGIEIIYKGNNEWVDALGRIVR